MLIAIIAFIIILGILILVHELGHFLLARKLGVRVEEFAFGFGPAIWKKKKKGVLWRINILPLGGYVKLLGEEGDSSDSDSFSRKSRLARASIIVSGVIMNFVLAWVIFTIGFAIGMPTIRDEKKIKGAAVQNQIMIQSVLENSPAERIGLKMGDIIIEMADKDQSIKIAAMEDIQNFTQSKKGQTIIVELDNKKREEVLLDDGDAPLGVSLINYTTIKTPFWLAPVQGLAETRQATWLILKGIYEFFKNILVEQELVDGASGPVGIFAYTKNAVQIGLAVLLQFTAILSINLGLINILPFPALDGGKILFIALESAFGRKTKLHEIENIIHLVGFVLLITLLVAITYRDVLRLGS